MTEPGAAGGARVHWVAMGGPDRASSRLRVHAWAPRLEALGYEVHVYAYHQPGGGQGDGWLARRSHRLSAALAAPELWRTLKEAVRLGDAVVFQEVLPPKSVLRAVADKGGRIGFDFSDPVHLANGPDHGLRHRVLHQAITLPRFRAMLAAARWTTVENDLLCPLGRSAGATVDVMRGPVDADLYVPRQSSPEDGGPVVGWAGSSATLPLMRPILDALRELAAEGHRFQLHLFGVRDDVTVDGVPVRVTPWSLEAEPEVVGTFDVGLNHMPMTPWTRMRGGAKLVFYQSCGVPTVTSPSGIGDQIVEDGTTGFVAPDRNAWKEAVRRLLDDPDLRVRMGAAARERAVSRYSYRAYLPRLTELLHGPA